MRRLSLLITLPVALILIVFAVRNRAATTLDLWPLPFAAEVPAYLLLFGGFALGVALGGGVLGFQIFRWRHRARRAGQRAHALEQQLHRRNGAAPPPLAVAAWHE